MARGGARPGAGRKSGSTDTYQRTMRGVVEQVVTLEVWEKVIRTAAAQAMSGDDRARNFLSPWVIGKVPDVVEVDHTTPLRIIIEGG